MTTIAKVVAFSWYQVVWRHFPHTNEWLITGVNELSKVSHIIDIECGRWCLEFKDPIEGVGGVRTHTCRVQAKHAEDAVKRANELHLGLGIVETP